MQDQAVRFRNEVAGRNGNSINHLNCLIQIGAGSFVLQKTYRGWSGKIGGVCTGAV